MRSRFPSSLRRTALFMLTMSGLVFGFCQHASAQITVPRMPSAPGDRYTSLEDQLINRLRATTEQQQSYIRYVVQQVKEGNLEIKMVVAMERYAIRRRPDFPLPFFERAMRLQATRVGVVLPAVQTFVATPGPPRR